MIFELGRKARTSPAAVGVLSLLTGAALALTAGASEANPAPGKMEALKAEGVDVSAEGMLHNPAAEPQEPRVELAATSLAPGHYTLIFPSGKYLLVEIDTATDAETIKRFARSESARIEPTPEITPAQMDHPPVTAGWEREILDVAHAHSRYQASGEGVTVAVIDSGIDTTHPVLENTDVRAGVSLPGLDPLEDPLWHGTPIAAIIAGSPETERGRSGLAQHAVITSHRVFGAAGEGTPRSAPALVDAINDAADSGTDVINLSLSIREDWTPLRDAVENAVSEGSIVVASAGNTQWGEGPASISRFPAAYDGVVGVGATWIEGDELVLAAYTNDSAEVVDLFAPGTVYAPARSEDGYLRLTHGTSMAAPHVSAAAALARNLDPDLSPTAVMALLKDTSIEMGNGRKHLHIGQLVATVHERLPFSFSDVPPANAHYGSIRWAMEQGITQGTGPDRFSPYRQVTRGEMTEFLYRLLGPGEQDAEHAEQRFEDVPADHRFASAISWAAANQVVLGHNDGTFRPSAPVTRAAAVTLLHRVAGEPEHVTQTVDFTDVSDDSYSAHPVVWGHESGVVTGYPDGTFRPTGTATRAAAMTLLRRVAPLVLDDSDEDPPTVAAHEADAAPG